MPITTCSAWRILGAYRDSVARFHLRDWFVADPARFSRRSLEFEGILVDFSKQRVDQRALELLLDLTKDADLEGWRDRLFSGEKINFSENRAVLHPALRYLKTGPFPTAETDVMPQVRAVRAHMRQFSERVRAGLWRGFSGEAIRDVVNIGIGGSDLGPKMVVRGL